jgi:hypothetical protein
MSTTTKPKAASTTISTPVLASITFDCADALVAANFWSAVLDRPVPEDATSGFAQLAGTPAWTFLAVPEPKSAKNRVHVDLDVEDLASAVDRVVGLGATRIADFDEQGYRWTTLADPDGNEFDLVAAPVASP